MQVKTDSKYACTNTFKMKNALNRFAYAVKGVIVFFREGTHAKFHLLASVIAVTAGVFFHITFIEWIAVVLCIGMVLAAEMLNTAIELLGDFVHKEQHPLIGKIKDISAGAVLFAALAAGITGCIIFIPYILKL
jgi:diacylglycerol kinase